jgi:DNA-binding response OmpR family regulator
MNRKILIVDDEPNIVMSLEFLMRKNRFDVFIARNGMEAMDLLAREVPDLILLDIMMPDVDGYEICQYVRENDRFDNSKVVFLSAKSKQSDIEKGYALGADLYVTKPFSTRDLLQNVKQLLEE